MNVVYKSLNDKKIDKKSTNVRTRRVKSDDGDTVTVYSLDQNSPTIVDDITFVFRQNVKRARRDLKKLREASIDLAKKA